MYRSIQELCWNDSTSTLHTACSFADYKTVTILTTKHIQPRMSSLFKIKGITPVFKKDNHALSYQHSELYVFELLLRAPPILLLNWKASQFLWSSSNPMLCSVHLYDPISSKRKCTCPSAVHMCSGRMQGNLGEWCLRPPSPTLCDTPLHMCII
jgi:hypothetical protein